MSDDEKSHFKKPDFIILEDTKDYIYGSQTVTEDEELWQMQRKKYPIWLRALCFLGVFGSLFFASAVLSYLLFLFLGAALYLFQSKEANQSFYKFWRLFNNTVAVTTSLLIGIFSPTLGIGMLIIYFSVRGEDKDRQFLKRTLKRFL
jgi:hypothetical protein